MLNPFGWSRQQSTAGLSLGMGIPPRACVSPGLIDQIALKYQM